MFFKVCIFLIFYMASLQIWAQSDTDSLSQQNWNFHFQQTVVTQYKSKLYPKYTSFNTLKSSEPPQTSLTSTIFIVRRLWTGAKLYINPEIAGGTGLSQARGIAGFPNGETFRIGNPKPQLYMARLFVRQVINLSGQYTYVEDNVNQLAGKEPTSFIALSVGRYSVADYFDNNSYSHDPRKQFLNWSLMSNGAWDYPANTRGYTWGFVAEVVKPEWALRFSSSLVPKQANGAIMDLNVKQAKSQTIEFEKKYNVTGKKGTLRLLTFFTQADMGNYTRAVAQATDTTDIVATRIAGRTKYGVGISMQQELADDLGLFFRASWNDGKNETWAFTEIDHSVSLGVYIDGNRWKRASDHAGIALVANGISIEHQRYLKAGGYGFMIGDGNLDYAPEYIGEVYYSFQLPACHFFLSPDYQCILNPGYDRANKGPVHIIGIRAHIEF